MSPTTLPRAPLARHAPAIAARLDELADRLERSDDWHDILDALACRNMARILRR